MTPPAPPVQGQPDALPQAARAEAARYALLRRLAPSMRHHLVVNLQPIGMVYEVMDRRLRAPQPNLAEVHDSAQKMNTYARAAMDSCLDVVTWLAPEADRTTTATEAVSECLGLLATSLAFRGFAVRDDVTALPGEVRRSSVRHVLTAALVCLTDQNEAPAEIRLSAEARPQSLVFTLTLKPTQAELGLTPAPGYRALDWTDLQALAEAESAQVERDGALVRISLPWVAA